MSTQERDEKNLTVRQLLLAFLAVVALCAVFFSLGFFVGYKERLSSATPVAETVPPPSEVPPPVNPPLQQEEAGSAGEATPPSSVSPASNVRPPASSAPGPVPSVTPSTTPVRAANRPSVSAEPSVSPRPANPAAAMSPSTSEAGGITVQLAALRNQQDAQAMIDVLKAQGYSAFLMTPEQAHANDNYFRVLVGPFKSTADAQAARQKLTQAGFKPFIRK